MIKMKIGKIVVLLLALVIFSSVGAFAREARKEIVLGCETSILPATVWVAENKGIFQKEGLKVIIKEFDSGRAAFNAMLTEGDIDMVTVAQTPIVLASFQRSDFAIVACMVTSDNDVKVCGRKDKGIKTPADLKGKKIGMTFGSTGQYFLFLFLLNYMMPVSEIQAVNLKTSELAKALTEGSVDAISTWEPNILNAKKGLGDNIVIFDSKGIFREDFYFVPSKNFLMNNPDAIKKFLRAIKTATEFMRRHKEESMDIVAKRLKLKRDLVALVWQDFNFRLMIDQTILMGLENEARWAVKNGLTEKKIIPNYLHFIYSETLSEIDPEMVTIIR